MLLSLLFTYSNGGWVGVIAGFFTFLLLSGRMRSSLLVLSFIVMIAILLMTFFPAEVNVQLLHASNPREVSLRAGAWRTALETIRAFPLTGVGLGYSAYQLGTRPFSFLEAGAYSQSHDSYLEWAVMAGIPILLIFVALLLFALWTALRNWRRANVHTRALIAGGMAVSVSLSFSSITINGWTHPVMAEVGWLVLGAITSPLLTQSFSHKQCKGIEGSVSKESLMLDQEIFS
jgi:O-antigen ligase